MIDYCLNNYAEQFKRSAYLNYLICDYGNVRRTDTLIPAKFRVVRFIVV